MSNTSDDTGASGGDNISIQRPVAEAVDALVAEAVNRRLRKDFSGAITALIDALRLDPNSIPLALMMAGIYEEREMPDEALLWYSSAEKLDPTNEAAVDGIHRLTSHLRFAPERGHVANATGVNVRVWGAVVAALLVLLVLAILMRNARQNAVAVSPRALTTAPPPRSVVIPGVPRATTTPTPTPARPVRPNTGAAASAGAALGSVQARTAPEAAIRSTLQETQGYWSPQARIDDVTADPRYAAVAVTFSLPANTQINRATILQNAFYIAAASFLAHDEVQVVTVRCAIPGEQTGYQLAFVGDILRQTALSYGQSVTTAQISASFTSVWWNPRLTQ